jgi:ketosteroid isomerase-like protein
MPTNIDTVKTIYENFQRGDVPAILARLHEDVEWEHDTVNHGIPWIVL